MDKDFFEDEDTEEPSFSLEDFRKWMSQQKKPKKLSETIKQEKKDELKEKFKKRFKDRLRKKDEI